MVCFGAVTVVWCCDASVPTLSMDHTLTVVSEEQETTVLRERIMFQLTAKCQPQCARERERGIAGKYLFGWCREQCHWPNLCDAQTNPRTRNLPCQENSNTVREKFKEDTTNGWFYLWGSWRRRRGCGEPASNDRVAPGWNEPWPPCIEVVIVEGQRVDTETVGESGAFWRWRSLEQEPHPFAQRSIGPPLPPCLPMPLGGADGSISCCRLGRIWWWSRSCTCEWKLGSGGGWSLPLAVGRHQSAWMNREGKRKSREQSRAEMRTTTHTLKSLTTALPP